MTKLNGHKVPFNTQVKLELVQTTDLAGEWPFLLEQLQSAPELWNSQYTLSGLGQRLLIGHSQLWVAKDDGGVRLFWILSDVWIRAGDGLKVLQIWWMQGERFLENMPVVVDTLRRLVEQQQFHSVTVSGRRAWERVLQPHGFKLHRVELTREL